MRQKQFTSVPCFLYNSKEWFELNKTNLSWLIMKSAFRLNKFVSTPCWLDPIICFQFPDNTETSICFYLVFNSRSCFCSMIIIQSMAVKTCIYRSDDTICRASTWNLRSGNFTWIFHEKQTWMFINNQKLLFSGFFQIVFVWLFTQRKPLECWNLAVISETFFGVFWIIVQNQNKFTTFSLTEW